MPIYLEKMNDNEKIEESWKKRGKVEFNLMNALITNSEDKLNDIEIILLSANEVYNKYLY